MARETKVQRIARAEAELARQEEEYVKAYPEKLMNILRRASEYGFELTVTKEKLFRVYESKMGYDFLMPHSIFKTTWHPQCEELSRYLDERDEDIKRESRKSDLRFAALSKLSKEEKEVLGL